MTKKYNPVDLLNQLREIIDLPERIISLDLHIEAESFPIIKITQEIDGAFKNGTLTRQFKPTEIKDLNVAKKEETEEHTGGSSSYYMAHVQNPTTLESEYEVECNDVIEALDLTFAEANIVKAIWRTAAERQGKKKKGNNAVYDAEKCCFFSERMLVAAKNNQ